MLQGFARGGSSVSGSATVRVTKGGRSDSNRHCGIHTPRCLPLHHGHHGAGTTGFEPAASRLRRSAQRSPAELRPDVLRMPRRRALTAAQGRRRQPAARGRLARRLALDVDSAGGIRTHGLELMRLARTAAPLPRKSGRLDSNQRSPVPETGGVGQPPPRPDGGPSTTLESNQAVPAYQTGAVPRSPVVVLSLAGRNRTSDIHRRRVALCSAELRRAEDGAPGTRTPYSRVQAACVPVWAPR